MTACVRSSSAGGFWRAQRLIDVGCGPGNFLAQIHRAGFAGALSGCDFSESATLSRLPQQSTGPFPQEFASAGDMQLMDSHSGNSPPLDRNATDAAVSSDARIVKRQISEKPIASPPSRRRQAAALIGSPLHAVTVSGDLLLFRFRLQRRKGHSSPPGLHPSMRFAPSPHAR